MTEPIYVISSDVEEREMLAALFTEYSVAAYPCVISAIEAAHHTRPAVMVCGISLLQFGVEELFTLISCERDLLSIPIVSLSLDSSRRSQLLRFGCAAVVDLPAENEEIALVVKQVLKRVSGNAPGFHGTFADVALIDLVQLLASSHTQGLLGVTVSGDRGELGFDQGQLVHARINGSNGEAAVLDLLRRSRNGGNFIFERGAIDKDKNIDKRTDHLLLGLASQIDESD